MNSNQKYTVRVLNADDAGAFRALRLHALKTEGEWLGPAYEDEVTIPYEQWREDVTPTEDMHYFGLFDRKKLIGAMRAAPWDEDNSRSTALWGRTYLLPEYRNQGLAKPLYVMREQWTKEHSRYTSAVLFIKHNNERSKNIHLRHGAELMCSRNMEWPHRPSSVWNWYRVILMKQEAARLVA
jgi:GNAT superfamily N-acetyltransferase